MIDAKLGQGENSTPLAGLSHSHGGEGLESRRASQSVERSSKPFTAAPPGWGGDRGLGTTALGYILRDRHQGNWNEPHSCLDVSEPWLKTDFLPSSACLLFITSAVQSRVDGVLPAPQPTVPREVSNKYKNTAPGLCFPWEGGAGLGICIFQVPRRRSTVGSRSCSVGCLGWRCQVFLGIPALTLAMAARERRAVAVCAPSHQEPGVISPSSLNLASVRKCI